MPRIQGPYPGGPRRHDEDEPRARVVLPSVEELEAQRHEATLRHRQRKRRRRIAAAFAGIVLLAAGTGLWLGIRSHRSPADVAREVERRDQTEQLLDTERRRILQELWRMEAAERAPRPPASR